MKMRVGFEMLYELPQPTPMIMSEQDAIRFRQQAGEARARAAEVTNVIDKEAWLLVAEDWLKLAQAVEARHAN